MAGANIILTYRCPNRCRYCFSGETKDPQGSPDLEPEELEWYLDFLRRSNCGNVRLLGGEPFLHPRFPEYLGRILGLDWVEHVTVFTSGFVPESFDTLLEDPRLNLVVNVNEPCDYPGSRFEYLAGVLRRLAARPVAMTVGFNIYRMDFDGRSVVALAAELGCESLRWSVAVPNLLANTQTLSRSERRAVMPRVLEFLEEVRRQDLLPVMDCPLEPCDFSVEQLGRFARLCPADVPRLGRCCPVIDLGPGSCAYRCFAVGSAARLVARDFETLQDLDGRFGEIFDAFRVMYPLEECAGCDELGSTRCLGGCLGFRGESMERLLAAHDDVAATLEMVKGFREVNDQAGTKEALELGCRNHPVPRMLAEYGAYLYQADSPVVFMDFVKKHEAVLGRSTIPGALFLMAEYHRASGRGVSAIRSYHRLLQVSRPERREAIRAAIRQCGKSAEGPDGDSPDCSH